MIKKLFVFIFIMLLVVTISIPGITLCDSPSSYYLVKENTYLNVTTTTQVALGGSISITASWYVRMTTDPDINENGILYKVVEYNGIKGNVDASKLSAKSITLTTPPHYTTTFTTKSSGAKIMLYKDSDANDPSRSIANGEEITYLARSYQGSTLTYLISYRYSGQPTLGFIESVNTTNIDVIESANPNKIDPDIGGTAGDGGNTLSPPKGDTVTTEGANITRILLIVSICILAVLIVFLIFKPSKRTSKDDYYDA